MITEINVTEICKHYKIAFTPAQVYTFMCDNAVWLARADILDSYDVYVCLAKIRRQIIPQGFTK